jgi:hypothetical protein
MRLHRNARLTAHGRMLLSQRVRDDGWTVTRAAEAAGCSERTCYRCLARYNAGDPMTDRSSAPRSEPGRTTWTRPASAAPPNTISQRSRALVVASLHPE